jgi:pyruvate-formate lyase-activating enzyme
MLGFPGETEKEFEETLNFLKENYEYIDYAEVFIFAILDHSPLKENLRKFGISKIKARAFQQYSYELNGIPYEIFTKEYNKRKKIIEKMFKNKNKVNCSSMIFPLYDNLKKKEKVKLFLSKEKEIFVKESGFGILFLGFASNHCLKGNLMHSKIISNKFFKTNNILQNLKEISKQGKKKLVISGGEPLIHPDILRIFAESKNHNFEKIVVKTNARMLSYMNFCSKIAEYVDEILVISPSENEQEYDATSGVPGSFAQALKGMRNWKSLNKKIRYYSG